MTKIKRQLIVTIVSELHGVHSDVLELCVRLLLCNSTYYNFMYCNNIIVAGSPSRFPIGLTIDTVKQRANNDGDDSVVVITVRIIYNDVK